MRRVGLVLLAIGVAGFLLATYERRIHESVPGVPGGLAASEARTGEAKAAASWETARWLLAGTAVIGAVFTILPGKRD